MVYCDRRNAAVPYKTQKGVHDGMQRFFRIYRIVLVVALILMLIPIIAAAGYTRPVMDDLCAPLEAARAWRETGSVFETVAAGVKSAVDYYMNVSGIFAYMLLAALPVSVFDPKLMGIEVLLTVGIYLLGMWCLARCLKTVCKGISSAAVACAWLLLCLMGLLLMPSYCESIFWYAGAANYTWGVALELAVFSALLLWCCKGGVGIGRLALCSVGAFLLGGMNWMTATSSLVVAGAFAIGICWKRRPRRLLVPLLCLAAGYAVTVLGPGNMVRQEAINLDVPLLKAFFYSFLDSFTYLFSDARPFLFTVLMVPVFLEIYRKTDLQYKNALWLPALSICILAATRFPVEYQAGYWAPRHINTCFMTVCILLPVNVFWCIGWVLKRCNVQLDRVRAGSRRGAAVAMACAAATIGILSVPDLAFSPLRLRCTLQPVKLVSHLLDGQIAQFTVNYDELAAYVQAHPGEHIITGTPIVEEMMTPSAQIIEDATDWRNTSFCEYYGEDCTIAFGTEPLPE